MQPYFMQGLILAILRSTFQPFKKYVLTQNRHSKVYICIKPTIIRVYSQPRSAILGLHYFSLKSPFKVNISAQNPHFKVYILAQKQPFQGICFSLKYISALNRHFKVYFGTNLKFYLLSFVRLDHWSCSDVVMHTVTTKRRNCSTSGVRDTFECSTIFSTSKIYLNVNRPSSKP